MLAGNGGEDEMLDFIEETGGPLSLPSRLGGIHWRDEHAMEKVRERRISDFGF